MELGRFIFKKLTGNISRKEEKLLKEWINISEENKALFSRFEALKKNGHDLSDIVHVDSNHAWSKVLKKLEAENSRKQQPFMFKTLLRYAAIFIGVLGLSYGYWTYTSPNLSNRIVVNNNLDNITLQLTNGDIKVISPNESQIINDSQGNVLKTTKGKNELDYSNISTSEKLVYNTLSVPYGKRFKIILSDGSKVHLNAGSSLKYPVKFLNGKERYVVLSGEAFFDVSHDKENPFVVASGDMNVRVLGTKFNVTAYKESLKINTVLVEGSVSLYSALDKYNDESSTLLNPGYKATWNNSKEKINIEKVDTSIYTEWMNGKLVFRKLLFKDIIQKLQRHYNVSIKNNYKELDEQIFTAIFDVETIEEVLESFAEDTYFDYEINGSQIIINKPINNKL